MPQSLTSPALQRSVRHLVQHVALAAALCAGLPAQARPGLSEASIAVSLAPVAASVGVIGAGGMVLSAAPLAVLSAGTALVIVSVEVIGGATVWVLERVSDGVRGGGQRQVEQGLGLAQATLQALDASGAEVVLLARAGQDLSKYGLRWSHLGFAYRQDGVWRVLHKLNHCGTDESALYRQGLG